LLELRAYLSARDLGDEIGDKALDLGRWQVVADNGVGLAEIAANHEGAHPARARLFACVTLSPPTLVPGGFADRSNMARAVSPSKSLSMSLGSARRRRTQVNADRVHTCFEHAKRGLGACAAGPGAAP